MSHASDVQSYIDGVLSGEILAGRLEQLAVRRHLDDLEQASDRGYSFDASAAEFAIDFYEAVLRHSTGEWEGKPFELEPWQKFIFWNVFGWRRADGTRRFRKVYEEIARKNGKTAKLAGIGLLLMECDDPPEPRAEIYCAATKEEQADLLFAEAVRMMRASPSLTRRLKYFRSKSRIVDPTDDSFFRRIGGDSNSSDGFNPHGVLKDELHAWRETHRGLSEKLSTGGASRRQPLEWIITTAGDDKSQIWREEREAAVRVVECVLTGEVLDDELFVFVCCIDQDDDPLGDKMTKEDFAAYLESDQFRRVMRKANPNLGVSVKLDYLRSFANTARYNPTKRNAFYRYLCNRAVASRERAILPELWAACGGPLSEEFGLVPACGGFDLARSDDFAAAVVMVPLMRHDEEGRAFTRYEVKCWAWTCEERREQLRTVWFQEWVDREDVRLAVHPSDQIDFTVVEDELAAITGEYQVRSWSFDDTFARVVAQNLTEKHGIRVFPFFQTPRNYNEPLRKFLRLIRQPGAFGHGDDPLLAWMAGNLTIVKNARDEWMPDKGPSGDLKIDGMVALLMAYADCLFYEAEPQPTYYETHELEVG